MNKSKILFLHDLESFSPEQLENVLILTRKMHARLTILHVKVPLKVVQADNQYSAKRELYEDYRTTIKKMGELCPKERTKDIVLNCEVLYGNLKSCVLERMAELRPDVVIMGEPKKKKIPFLGHNLLSAVQKRAANLMVANNASGFMAYNDFQVTVNTDLQKHISVSELTQALKLPFSIEVIKDRSISA